MTSALLDTNVLVSGILGYNLTQNVPGQILRLWRAEEFQLIVSDHILNELAQTLVAPYFVRRLQVEVAQEVIDALRSDAVIQPIQAVSSGVATHPEDDLVIAAALSAKVPFLVSGDKQLLRLAAIEQTRLVTPRTFLEVLAA